MSGTHTTVLLAGDTAARSATLRKWLSDRRCHFQCAKSFQDACRVLSQGKFDLVLCQYELPDRTAFPLLDWLEGSPSTLIFAAKSGRSSRWLPVVERGKRCLDRPLLRTADLPNTLGDMLDTRPQRCRGKRSVGGQLRKGEHRIRPPGASARK
jgi:CheY-like chemotaxis protein